MIVIVTVFKYSGEGMAAAREAARDALEAMHQSVQAEMLDTGRMLFFYEGLKFIGSEVAGVHWDDAAIYAVRDWDAMREWMLWDKHKAVDVAMANAHGLAGVLPLQFSDEEDAGDSLERFRAILEEGAYDRARSGALVDFCAARLGPDYTIEGLEKALPVG